MKKTRPFTRIERIIDLNTNKNNKNNYIVFLSG